VTLTEPRLEAPVAPPVADGGWRTISRQRVEPTVDLLVVGVLAVALLGNAVGAAAVLLLVGRALRVAVLTDGRRLRIRNVLRTVTVDWADVRGLDHGRQFGLGGPIPRFRLRIAGRPPITVTGASASFRRDRRDSLASLAERPLVREVSDRGLPVDLVPIDRRR
jgi:hypothetical protein